MSEMAEWHTREWAKDKSDEEIIARIHELQNAPEHEGYEFDDIRVRHWRAVRIRTLHRILEERGYDFQEDHSEEKR